MMKSIEELLNSNPEEAFQQIRICIGQNPQDENVIMLLISAPDYYQNWNKKQQKEFYTLLNFARSNLKLNDMSLYWELLLLWENYALEELDVLAILSVYFNFIKHYPNTDSAVKYYADKCASFQTYPDFDFIELGIKKLTNSKTQSLTWIKMVQIELNVDLGRNGKSIRERWGKIIEYVNQAIQLDKETASQALLILFEDYSDSDFENEMNELIARVNQIKL